MIIIIPITIRIWLQYNQTEQYNNSALNNLMLTKTSEQIKQKIIPTQMVKIYEGWLTTRLDAPNNNFMILNLLIAN